MTGKKKREEKSNLPSPIVPPPAPPSRVPPRFPSGPPPATLSASDLASLKSEMLKELQRGDQAIRGLYQMKYGDLSRGQYLMGKAINPDHPETINNIGLCYYSRGDFAGAIAQYQLAISKKADYAIFWWNLALAQMKSKQLDATLSSLQRTIELDDKFRAEAIKEETFAPLRNNQTFLSHIKSKKAMRN